MSLRYADKSLPDLLARPSRHYAVNEVKKKNFITRKNQYFKKASLYGGGSVTA